MVRVVIESLEARALLSSTRFAVIGDFGQPQNGEPAVAAMVKSWNPDSILTVGDNSYPDASTQALLDTNIGQFYHEYIYNYSGIYGAGSPTRRFYPALGNHDWGNVYPGGNASQYLQYFDLPGNERYYDFVQGPVHFFVVDSDQNEPGGTTAASVQGQWLKNGLASATERHKVVLFHHPPYNSGTAHGSELRMRWPFAKWGATAVLAGHEHTYERLSEEGIPYFVNGLGGASRASIGTLIAGSQFNYDDNYGAMLIEADDTRMTFKFYAIGIPTPIDTYVLDLAATTKLVNAGANWNYLVQDSAPTGLWKQPGYVPTGWSSGAVQLGYGDGDEATGVGFGPNSGTKYITTYFRKSINVPNPLAITSLNLHLLRDDGAVVYLNRTEVFRTNLPAGAIAHSTLALSAIGGADEGNWYSTSINPSLLQAGENVLAVELHQSGGTSSDISFDLALTAGLDIVAPQVSAPTFLWDAPRMAVQYTFSESVQASLHAADLVLRNTTTSQIINPDDIDLVYDAGSNTATFTFPGLSNGILPDGDWEASLNVAGVKDVAGNFIASDGLFEFFVLGGDANHDGAVGLADLRALALHWDQENQSASSGDFNYDGQVDSLDLGILSQHWQTSVTPAIASTAPARATRAPVRIAKLI